MNSISRIQIFVEVAKQQSFAAAGRSLGLSGAAVSKQVQTLESQLGVRLLNRTTRHVSLSEEGEIYYQRARKAVEDLREAEQQILEMKECPTGKLKVNAPMSFGTQYLTSPIAKFVKKHPHVEMEVDFDDRWVDVVAEGYDVVVRIGVLEDSTLKARKLASCPIVLCASPECIEREGDPQDVAQMSEYPAVTYNRHGRSEDWHYRGATSKGRIRLRRVFASNNAEMQREACLAGVGAALMPLFSVEQLLSSGELIRLLPDYHTAPERGIYALYPQNRYPSTRVRLFIDSLVESLGQYAW